MDDHYQPAPAPADPYQPQPAPEQKTARRPATRRPAARRSERALLRRAAQLALDLHSMELDDRDLFAAILGLSAQTPTVEIAATAAAATAKDLRAGLDAQNALTLDPIEAGVTIAALGRQRMAAVWRVFSVFSSVSGEMPSSDAKAALTIARAIGDGSAVELRLALDEAMKRFAER